MGRAANNPSRFKKSCERCKTPLERWRHPRLNLFPDDGGLVSVAVVCRQCVLIAVSEATADLAPTGRWELFCYGTAKPLMGGTYGRPATAEETARAHIVGDSERNAYQPPQVTTA